MNKKISERLPYKYAPNQFNELILNDKIKLKLKKSLIEFPTMFLVGPRGIGKGSFTHVFLNETKLDYIWINGGQEKGIDTVREKITTFAASMGNTNIKYIIFNEIDRLTADAQNALLDTIERYHKITRFIFMANNINQIFPELLSRCQIFEFSEPPAEQIYKHCLNILNKENVKIKNKNVIIKIIKKFYPDIRHILNTLDQNIINKILNDDIIIYDPQKINDDIINNMLQYKDNNVDNIRKILKTKAIDYISLYSRINERIEEFNNLGIVIDKLGDAIRYHNIVALPEINFIKFVVEVMKYG